MPFLLLLLLGSLAAWPVRAGDSKPPTTVWTLDVAPLHALDLHQPAQARTLWDTMHVVSALQGLANRTSPRISLFCCRQFGVDTDRFWLQWLREEDGWLRNTDVRALTNLDAVIAQFRDAFQGLVVYDGNVTATAVIASTAAGVEGLLTRFQNLAPST